MSNRWLPVAALLGLSVVLGASEHDTVEMQFEQMSDLQKRQLLEKKRLFEGLDEVEQQRLRAMHVQLQAARDRDLLLDIMKQYSEWIRALPSGQRVELLSMPVAERLVAIKQIQQDQQERQLRELSGSQLGLEDSQVISRWLDSLIKKYRRELQASRAEIIAQMGQNQQLWLNRIPDSPQRDRILAATLVNQVTRLDDQSSSPVPVVVELEGLVEKLSQRGQNLYQGVEGERERQQVLARWSFFAALRSLRIVSEEELVRFYLEDLSPQDRDELDHYSGERFRRELNAYYIRDKGLGSSFNRRRESE